MAGMLHADRTFAQHPRIPNLNRPSPSLVSIVPSLQQQHSISPTASSDRPPNVADISDAELTTPTSSSAFSSQDREKFVGHDNVSCAVERVDADTLFAPTAKSPVAGPKIAKTPPEPLTASKRTSSGQIKRSSISAANAHKSTDESVSARSRTSSFLSNGSSVTELSQQLRTRLSYAMVKIKNGWESNTLEEIQGLAPKRLSPKSSRPATTGDQTSPSPGAIQNPNSRLERISSDSSANSVAPDGVSLIHHRDAMARGQPQRLMNVLERPSLAPPADIVPGTRRRPHHADQPLNTNAYNSQNSQNSQGAKQRTASQNAAMEADAVETLLFLASPGNSGHNPSNSGAMTSSPWMSAATSVQVSPLKSDFSSQELAPTPQKRVAFTGLPNPIPKAADIRSEIDIDRMIDEMDDASTDGGLDYVDRATGQQPGVDHTVPA